MTRDVSEQQCDVTHGGFPSQQPVSVSSPLKGFSFKLGFHEPQGELTHSAKPGVGSG